MTIGNYMTDKTPKLYLSRRNLLALLSKLDRDDAGEKTECSIIKHQLPTAAYKQTMKEIMVVAVQDDEYYIDRPAPSEMHPADEVTARIIGAQLDALPILIEAVKRLPDAAAVLRAWDRARMPR